MLQNRENRNKNFSFKLVIRFLISFLISIILVFLLRDFYVFPYTISNTFMEPNLPKGKKVFFRKNISDSNLFIGNILMVKRADDSIFIGRLVGKPGDTIYIEDKKISRNGLFTKDKFAVFNDSRAPLTEKVSNRDNLNEFTIKEKQYFILADNRDIGIDSRELGLVSIDSIIGKVWF